MKAIQSVMESWVLAYLLNSLWQVPLVFVAALAAARLARKAGPQMEHRVWVGALFLQVLLALLPHAGWRSLSASLGIRALVPAPRARRRKSAGLCRGWLLRLAWRCRGTPLRSLQLRPRPILVGIRLLRRASRLGDVDHRIHAPRRAQTAPQRAKQGQRSIAF